MRGRLLQIGGICSGIDFGQNATDEFWPSGVRLDLESGCECVECEYYISRLGAFKTNAVVAVVCSSDVTHLSGTGQPITGLSDANVQAQFADMQIAHHILRLVRLRLLGLLGSNGLGGGLSTTTNTKRQIRIGLEKFGSTKLRASSLVSDVCCNSLRGLLRALPTHSITSHITLANNDDDDNNTTTTH